LILTAGSQGDVQPFVALGIGLKKAGHEVTICTCESFKNFVTEYDLGYAYMNDGIVQLVHTTEARQAFESGKKLNFNLIKKMRHVFRQMLAEEWGAAENMDAILYHPNAMGGFDIAEKLEIPSFMCLLMPTHVPTRDFPLFIFPNLNLGWLNKLSYNVPRLMSFSYMGVVNKWRKEILNLPHRSAMRGEL